MGTKNSTPFGGAGKTYTRYSFHKSYERALDKKADLAEEFGSVVQLEEVSRPRKGWAVYVRKGKTLATKAGIKHTKPTATRWGRR